MYSNAHFKWNLQMRRTKPAGWSHRFNHSKGSEGSFFVVALLDEDPTLTKINLRKCTHFYVLLWGRTYSMGLLSVAVLTQPEQSWTWPKVTNLDRWCNDNWCLENHHQSLCLLLNIDILMKSKTIKVPLQKSALMSLCAYVPEPPKGPWVSFALICNQNKSYLWRNSNTSLWYSLHVLSQGRTSLLRKAIFNYLMWSSRLTSLDKSWKIIPNLPKWLKKSYEKGRKYIKEPTWIKLQNQKTKDEPWKNSCLVFLSSRIWKNKTIITTR